MSVLAYIVPSAVGPNDPVLGEKALQVSPSLGTAIKCTYFIHPLHTLPGMRTG